MSAFTNAASLTHSQYQRFKFVVSFGAFHPSAVERPKLSGQLPPPPLLSFMPSQPYWLAVDDMDLGVDGRVAGHFLKTDLSYGLVAADVETGLALLRAQQGSAPPYAMPPNGRPPAYSKEHKKGVGAGGRGCPPLLGPGGGWAEVGGPRRQGNASLTCRANQILGGLLICVFFCIFDCFESGSTPSWAPFKPRGLFQPAHVSKFPKFRSSELDLPGFVWPASPSTVAQVPFYS